jgi:hypothetical protein
MVGRPDPPTGCARSARIRTDPRRGRSGAPGSRPAGTSSRLDARGDAGRTGVVGWRGRARDLGGAARRGHPLALGRSVPRAHRSRVSVRGSEPRGVRWMARSGPMLRGPEPGAPFVGFGRDGSRRSPTHLVGDGRGLAAASSSCGPGCRAVDRRRRLLEQRRSIRWERRSSCSHIARCGGARPRGEDRAGAPAGSRSTFRDRSGSSRRDRGFHRVPRSLPGWRETR